MVNEDGSDVIHGYGSRAPAILGACQMTVGGLMITLGVVTVIIQSAFYVAGAPFWVGLYFIVTGVFGILSSSRKARNIIVVFMVLSILAAILAGVFIIAYLIAITLEGLFVDSIEECYFGTWSNEKCDGLTRRNRIVNGVLVILAVIECVIAIISSVICCKSVCTCCGGEPEMIVVYSPDKEGK
ncbi:membrane-spanning 4-domains subfamily A member 12-like [Ptychodera flava]|uniref:membrane-spanning 4-domains subfamily A member 12-like n=1 Tax=Ptychodera flava TaxID=63121 RepID=UPI00396A9EF0